MATTTLTTSDDTSPVPSILHHAAPRAFTFRFSPFLRQAYQVGLPPDRPICKAYQTGSCPNGTRCLERHVQDAKPSGHHHHHHQSGGLNSLVCKHWLRGLCKKGEHCEFLHEYNLRKMPECNFFMRNGYCSNGEECLYLHLDPSARLPPCPHYDMGFCPLGPDCAKKHVRRKICGFYLAGFCPDGPDCAAAHPKWKKDLEKPSLKSEDKAAAHENNGSGGGGGNNNEGAAGPPGRSLDDEGDRDRGRMDRDEGRFGRHRGSGGGGGGGAGGGGGGGGKWRNRGGRYRGRGH